MKAGIKGLILMVIMIFMITGCLPQLVNGGYDKFHLDAFKYNTFRLVTPKDGSLPADMTLDDYNIIAESIRAEMLKRGFREAEDAPLFINIGLTTEMKPDMEGQFPKGAYPVFIASRNDYLNSYSYSGNDLSKWLEPGKIVLDLVDAIDFKYMFSLTTDGVLDMKTGKIKKENISFLITSLLRDLKIRNINEASVFD